MGMATCATVLGLQQLTKAFAIHQRAMIDAAGTFKDTRAIQASHSPFFSKPEETAEYICESIQKHFS